LADDSFAPDEWDPAQLWRHLPFPPPVVVDLSVFDTGPLLVFLVEATLYYRGWHASLPWWFPWAVGAASLLWLVHVCVRPKRRRLLAWLPVLWRYFALWACAPWLMRPIPYRWARRIHRGGVVGRWTILLSRDQGRTRLANVTVDDDGVIDASAGARANPPVRFVRWLFALARGQEWLVRLVWVSDTGSLDLLDPEAREGVWAARDELLRRPDHRLAIYLRTRPFPVRELLLAAGEVGAAADAAQDGRASERQEALLGGGEDILAWAATQVQRRVLLAVPAARRTILNRRLLDLLGVGDQGGKLSRAGLAGRVLDRDEVLTLLADAWGPDLSPAVAISPNRIEVETGGQDPAPLGDAPEQPAAGNPGVRRHRTYVVRGLLDRIYVGWTEALTGRNIHGDVVMHVEPISDSWAEAVLGLKAVWWRGLSLGAEKYALAATQALRTLNLIRRRRSAAIRFGMYATVAETQAPAAELALKEMVGKDNFSVPTYEQLQARIATEPTGRDPLDQKFWTDSQVAAMAWPGTGGIWVPGCTLIGESIRSHEPVGCNLWWEGDEAPIMFVAGRSGSGKTNGQQLFVGRHIRPHPEHWLAQHPPRVVVAYVKPWHEWWAFCKHYGGHHYALTTESWRQALAEAPLDSPVVAFNMRGIRIEQRGEFLDALERWVTRHQRGRRKKYPLIYVVGEAWAMKPGHLQQLALQDARALQIGLIVDTQFVDHLLRSDARDVIRTCGSFALMRLRKGERAILQEMFDIGEEGMKFLAQIAQPNTLSGGIAAVKGRCIFEAHGLRTQMQFRRFGFEAALLDQTNPRLLSDDYLDAEADLEFEPDDLASEIAEYAALADTNGHVRELAINGALHPVPHQQP